MEYITVKEAAAKWGVTPRRVQILCANGRIAGIERFGNRLMIPKDAIYPVGASQIAEIDQPLPRKTPFLYMSDLYNEAGSAEAVTAELSYNHEAQVLFAAEIAYNRGEIDKVYESANYLLKKHSGFYAVLSAGMLLALCAIWRGDLSMWRRAKLHISEAPAKNDNDRDIMSLAITAVDSMLYDVTGFPDWFKKGNFEPLHPDALPAAKVYYAKYLYAAGFAVATKQVEMQGVHGLSLMSILPLSIEPMISQAKADSSVIAEIYLRLTCATVYHTSGNQAEATRHIDRAVALALPDRLYGLLAEYCRVLGALLESRIVIADADAWENVKKLHKTYNEGWSNLSGAVRGKTIITTLSQNQREVAKLAAFGMSNAQIAEKLHLSLASVKQAVRIVSEKMGVGRSEFAAML
ncbi:MAG: hypothetical protein E7653_04505 [Ruminococcaceae bacterium]|nr:hypothetical protein [Oscillospiraceae bacterium]